MLPALVILSLASLVTAHIAAWGPGMYCKGGNDTSKDDPNTNLAVNPLYMKTKKDWWFQHHRGCDGAPPPANEFLELPAGRSFDVELAINRAFTTLSYPKKPKGAWPDGKEHPDDWQGTVKHGERCLVNNPDGEGGAMHTGNQSTAAGTAFAISYQSDLSKVTMDNLVVFTTLEHTPWKKEARYEVPAALPACPQGGCTCAWLWVPKGCGEGNMYMQGFKCKVIGATSTTPLATPKAPVYCLDDPSKCVKGAKQMIAWHQAEGNNIETSNGVSPGYNTMLGWATGAQNDIFDAPSQQTSSTSAAPTTMRTSTRSSVPTSSSSNSTSSTPTSKTQQAIDNSACEPSSS